MAITIDGLVSGLDTEAIVTGLLEIQQTQLDRMELKRADALAEQAVFSQLEGQMLTFRSDVSKLARVQNNPFERRQTTVSDETILSATASTSAANGVYRMTVDSVARAHQVASTGFADTDSEITQGTIELRVGSGDLTSIEVDGSNNTLSGLADSINASDSGITASVIQDASGGATPYKLLLTSSETGSANAISINNNLAATAGDATQPTFDFGNPVQAAADAQLTLGSGPGAISVTSDSNKFDTLITGVSINVLNASDGDEVTLSISNDNASAVTAVEDFVNSFNDVMSFIDDRSQFNENADESGPLLGNRSAQNIQQKLRNAVVSVVPGVNNAANRLSAIGVSVTDDGRLQLDKTRLNSILNGDDEDISRTDLRRMFTLDAESTNSKISFVLGTSRTKESDAPIQVDLTQAAEKATVTAGTALAASTVIDGSNRTIELELDGAEATISLNEGTYTQQELADHVEALIRDSSEMRGRTANVGLSGGALTVTSDTYGSSSQVKFKDGTALATLGFAPSTEDKGRDVAGTFTINGVTESATGRGQVLTGNADNEYTADLQLRVKLSPADIVSGPEAEVNVTMGLAASLDNILDGMLDPENGGLKTIDDRFNDEIASLQDAFDRQKELFDIQQQSLIEQFVALESAMSELQSTSDFVGTQLASLSASSKK
ncbi:flagellar filament capping protein FliD [Fuerstiella marisgermanici]|uniref:Flagellar hook-associated protein 2 n=1 Tax=Fuerstiella marisgermanici TaxID=1891926 RepID=A0A1P8WI00_9PLAN|nr:flagellar filament capping protein FliD [Fuerstiella marisgermanici]APZ93685.1 Flagellar cap protein [Fuerstiella marisgermanici]